MISSPRAPAVLKEATSFEEEYQRRLHAAPPPPTARTGPPIARFFAPFWVFFFRVILVWMIVSHRPKMLQLGFLSLLEWTTVLLASFTYICVVLCPPGFLNSKDTASKPPSPWAMLCAACAPVGVMLLPWLQTWKVEERIRGIIHPASRGALEARELQPITLGRGEDEDDEDPGEETIGMEDLEAARTGKVQKQDDETREINDETSKDLDFSFDDDGVQGGSSTNTSAVVVGTSDSGPSAFTKSLMRPPPPHFASRHCRICGLQQPLRTKHCRDCGRCVRTHDHHCPWIGTCIGEGNRVCFYWFVLAENLELTSFGIEGLLYLYNKHGTSFGDWISEDLVFSLGLAFMGILLMMVSSLLTFHTYLMMSNLTTWESMSWYKISYLKFMNAKLGSPFSRTLRANMAIFCCPPWCPAGGFGARQAHLELDSDGWAVWKAGEQNFPGLLECAPCGLGGRGFLLFPCFDARADMV